MAGPTTIAAEPRAFHNTTQAPQPAPMDEVELTTVRAPDFAHINLARRSVQAGAPRAAARGGIPAVTQLGDQVPRAFRAATAATRT